MGHLHEALGEDAADGREDGEALPADGAVGQVGIGLAVGAQGVALPALKYLKGEKIFFLNMVKFHLLPHLQWRLH